MAAAAWTALEAMFSSQMRGCAVNTHIALATAQKGNQFIAEYVGKLHALTDEMSTIGRPLDDDELVAYILTGLDADFNAFVSSLITKTKPISISELYAQLVTYENHMEGSSGSSTNLAK
jgi:hypothetical protein